MKNVLERLLNLLAFLLTAGRPVTADEIRSTVAGYDRGSDEAFHRMFERDKELLRSMGIPLDMRATDGWAVESGYVIDPEQYRSPDVDLTDEERAALWLAAQVVRIGGEPQGPEALLKLGGARVTAGVEPLAADLGAEVDLLADVFTAVAERRRIRFGYRDRIRTVAPYGLGHRRGHWYLVGEEGGEIRVFRVDRMDGVKAVGESGAFRRPEGFDLQKELETTPWRAGQDEPVTAEVVFDPDVSWWAAHRLGAGADARTGADGSIRVRMDVRNVDAFVGWVLTFGAHAEVLSPPELRQRVVDRARGVS